MKRLHAERAIEADFQQTDFLSVRIEIGDGFVRDFRAGAHHHDDALGIGRANVVEQLVAAADDFGKLVHDRLHLGGRSVVVGFAVSRIWKNTSGFWAVPRSTG